MSKKEVTGIFIIIVGIIIALSSLTQLNPESPLGGLIGIIIGVGVVVWGFFMFT